MAATASLGLCMCVWCMCVVYVGRVDTWVEESDIELWSIQELVIFATDFWHTNSPTVCIIDGVTDLQVQSQITCRGCIISGTLWVCVRMCV